MEKYLVEYDYFNDVNYNYRIDMGFKLEQRKDPDQLSAKLYDSFYHCFLNEFYQYPNRTIKIKIVSYQSYDKIKKIKDFGYSYHAYNAAKPYEQKHIVSIDYIGPSIHCAKEIAGLNDDEIKSLLAISRTLGGHIVWERNLGGKKTVNQARGGERDNGIWDRFDWTLLILKQWYEDKDKDKDKENSSDSCNGNLIVDYNLNDDERKRVNALYTAFEDSSNWLRLFENFKGFVDFFKLKNNFVDNDYNVVELTDFLPIKPQKYAYRRYIENSLSAIASRNEILEEQ